MTQPLATNLPNWLDLYLEATQFRNGPSDLPRRSFANFALADFALSDDATNDQTLFALNRIGGTFQNPSLVSPSMSNPVISGLVEYDGPVYGASNATVKTDSKQYGVRTTDATVTTIAGSPDFATPANGGLDFEGDVSAKQEGTANYLRMKLAISVVGNGGAWTLVGTLTQSDSRSNGTVTGWAVTAAIDGTGHLLIKVQGAVATNINWSLTGQWTIRTP